ncbi:MAG: tetratricopeptide repeat protein [Myxococcales bacterium]|nr:tetratricopeptide repeat protein [Myxococcales bacterium]
MQRSRLCRFLVCVALGGTIPFTLPAPEAEAQPSSCSRDDAKTRYLKGVDLFEEGDFQAALIEFKRSYECVPNFNVLYNIGQVYFQLQDYANALKTLSQYLDDGGKRIPQTRRSEVERDVEKLRARVATVTIKVSQPGADVFVDDVKIGTSPLPGPITVSSGKRKFDATKSGFRSTPKTEEIAGQENREVVIDLQPSTTVINVGGGGEGGAGGVVVGGEGGGPPPPPEEPAPVLPIVFWSLTGAFVVGTAVTGGLALGADSDLQEQKRTPNTSTDDIDSAASKARGLAIASDVLLGVSIVSAGLATYFTIDWALSSKKEEAQPADEATEPAAALYLGPGQAGVRGTF